MILLCILDGWGINEEKKGNAFKTANTPNLDAILAKYPKATITPSGTQVGLPVGQMGNSEVGHLNIGAGRIVNQSYQRINLAIENDKIKENTEFKGAIENAKQNNSALHFMGLLSDGGVHSSNQHLYSFVKQAKEAGLQKVFIHCFLDGRDTPPQSGSKYITELQDELNQIGIGQIATISGRYYAMDRDNRWERVIKAYDALTIGEGIKETNAIEAVTKSYENNINDEFVLPTVIEKDGSPIATIKDKDSVIFFNFRPDRAREISKALTNTEFNEFKRQSQPQTYFVCLTEYDNSIEAKVAFKPIELKNTLAEVLSKNNKKQLHIAETEKYAHVTFFFNGGVEKPYKGEDRILVPSPQVATYDLQPEMSALELTDKVLEAIESDKYDVIILNYANPDMVGHTGVMSAAVKAMETVDSCIGKVTEKIIKNKHKMLLTSDHGNLECMYDGDQPFTAHTTNDVPIVYIAKDSTNSKLKKNAILADIAPTILELTNIDVPKEMTGTSLFTN